MNGNGIRISEYQNIRAGEAEYQNIRGSEREDQSIRISEDQSGRIRISEYQRNGKMAIPRHEKLWVWQKAHTLRLKIHEICRQLPRSEQYRLAAQIEKASNSVADNIAEGNGSYYYNDKIKGFYTARKEASETQNHLRHMEGKRYLEGKIAQKLIDEYEEVLRGINGLVRAVSEKRDMKRNKGSKRI